MSEKAVILNLPAYNETEIISMVFRSFEQGVAYVEKVLGRGPDETKDGYASWDAYEFFNGVPSKLKEPMPKEIVDGEYEARRKWIDENEDKYTEPVKADYDQIRKLVKSYYGGCGEAGTVEVKVVDFDTPLCNFDFD